MRPFIFPQKTEAALANRVWKVVPPILNTIVRMTTLPSSANVRSENTVAPYSSEIHVGTGIAPALMSDDSAVADWAPTALTVNTHVTLL